MARKGFFDDCNNILFYKRKKGYSLMEIWKWKQSVDPLEDDLLSLNHCVRVCYEKELPFSTFQIKRVFNKVFKKEFHGSKVLSWNFIKKWSGNKMVKFKSEVKSKVPSTPPYGNKLTSPLHDKGKKVVGVGGSLK